MLQKHNNKSPLDLVHHLFHGSRNTPPASIYSSETGFDMRFCTNGANGIAIYFADNSAYSMGYVSATVHNGVRAN